MTSDSTPTPSEAVPSPTELLIAGVAAAHAAGELLLAQQDSAARSVWHKAGPFDLVTPADHAAEGVIRQEIQQRRPGDTVVGEEGGTLGAGVVRWLVDPLDGTVNYVQGLAAWAVSIAAEVNGGVVAAVVHAPAMDRTYTAAIGIGSSCNDRRLAGPRADHPRNAVIATGFAASASTRLYQAQPARPMAAARAGRPLPWHGLPGIVRGRRWPPRRLHRVRPPGVGYRRRRPYRPRSWRRRGGWTENRRAPDRRNARAVAFLASQIIHLEKE